MVVRLPVLLLGQLAGPPSDAWLFVTGTPAIVIYVLALLVLAAFGLLLVPLLRKDATMRFWVVGALIAALPPCATFPGDRLLVFVGLGAMGAIATLVVRMMGVAPETEPIPKSRWTRRFALVVIVACHLILAPLLLPARSLTTAILYGLQERADNVIPRSEDIRDRAFVVILAPFDGLTTYIPMHREAMGVPRPRALRVLATGHYPVGVTRLDEHTIRVRPEQGFYGSETERMVRSQSLLMERGETIRLSDMTVTVTEVTDDGRAAEAEFRFGVPLEDPSLLWVRFDREDGVVPYTPPPLGESETVPSPY